ncbi:hypothetical protein HDU92_005838 [Lobulomyces angularis]|nr:hypothetical protein HDU92_005838 [Lobulomyces angularis]
MKRSCGEEILIEKKQTTIKNSRNFEFKTDLTKKKKKTKKNEQDINLKQTQLNFTTSNKTKCHLCKMNYNLLIKEDVDAHKVFHQFELGLFEMNFQQLVVKNFFCGDKILLVDDNSPINAKKKAVEIWKFANEKLGGTAMDDKDDSNQIFKSRQLFILTDNSFAFKSIFVIEKIDFGFECTDKILQNLEYEDKTSGVTKCSDVPISCNLGVQLMFVKETERRKGIATKVLSFILKNYYNLSPENPIKNDDNEKEIVAFSQPTKFGRDFAKKFCKKSNFLVYHS